MFMDRSLIICKIGILGITSPICECSCCSVAKSCLTLRPHELQHIRFPYPSVTPGTCSNSCPLSQWCHPDISSSFTPFSSCPQSFPPSGSFPMSRLFTSGGQSIAASSSASVLTMIIRGWCPWELTGLISLQSRDSQENLLENHNSKASVWYSVFFMVHISHLYLTTGQTIALTIPTFVSKVMSLLCNTLSRFVIVFLPRSKHLLISWPQSLSTVILEPKKMKSDSVSTFSPSIFHEVMEPDIMVLVFWMFNFKPAFSLSSFTLIKRLFSSSLLSS